MSSMCGSMLHKVELGNSGAFGNYLQPLKNNRASKIWGAVCIKTFKRIDLYGTIDV